MTEILFMDPFILEWVESLEQVPPDPVLIDSVDNAINRLPLDLQLVIIQNTRMGMSAQQIANTNGLTKKQVRSALYEAKRQLRFYLADFVSARWNIPVKGRCRICAHPQRRAIEEMLRAKRQSEPWGSFNCRLLKMIGEQFNPPKILVSHLSHMKSGENNESR